MKYVIILELSKSVFRFELAQTVWKLQAPNTIAAFFIHNLIRPIRRIYVITYGTVVPLSIFGLFTTLLSIQAIQCCMIGQLTYDEQERI
jgi:hypothetical protein